MNQLKEAGTREELQRARAECFLLCDFARAENGKLYIVGGGWDRIVPQQLPLSYDAYLATKLVLPGELLADPVQVRVDLLDKNEHVLGEPVFESTIERDPVILPEEREGTLRSTATVLMGAAVKMEIAQPGRFTLRLLVNDETIASTSFTVSSLVAAQEH